MAFHKDDSQEDARECPVCYESLSGIERTLSCGHVFCHDCLVKTLVTVNGDGNAKGTITCPVCRHLTFIKKQKKAGASKDARQVQTLAVPLPLRHRDPGATRTGGFNGIAGCFRRMCERFHRQRLISPNVSQIFIISARGRPMAEEDALSGGMTVVAPQRRRRRRICTTARCLIFLLSTFTLVALVAATLPWILLA
ncbi:RING finger protein 222 [Betta splendens]|uniref:RING finger protein 222 n=1 Tax=Betta splendens TaxID=158456 RepID=A0A6P7N626_BETSP|nr:RING finger protein 222 [Betta splendens]